MQPPIFDDAGCHIHMNWLDLVLALILVIFAWRCFWLGFIKSVGSLIGLVAGSLVASYFYLKLFGMIGIAFGGLDNIGKVVCFFLLFAVFARLVYLVFVALDKAYDFLSIIPFLGPINNLAGAIFGVLIGLFFCSLLIYVSVRFFPAEGWFGSGLVGSKLAPYFLLAAKLLAPLLSGGLKSLKSII